MSKQAFYNGILYQIEYQPQLSNSDYTQHKVYHIKTEDENYPHARKVIASIMEDYFIREVIVDVYGRTIVLGGQYVFEYSITVISITGRIVVTNFKNGKEARKEFYKYKRKK